MFYSELEGFIQELKKPIHDELIMLFVQKMNRQPTTYYGCYCKFYWSESKNTETY